MKKSILRQYARLIAVSGVNVQKKQAVVIRAHLDQPEFVNSLVTECYRAGASEVAVEWEYQPLTKLHVKYQKPETLGKVEKWEEMRLLHRSETLPAMIYLESSDPDGLNGIDQEKWSKGLQSRQKVIKPIRDGMEDRYQWCIAAVPGEKWAKKMFPELPKGRAVEKLWETILTASRADKDPIEAWKAHNKDLKSRCDYLNSLGLTELNYKSENGTDLRVGLIPDSHFLAGAETTLGTNVVFNPNIPSEEVFISPMAGKAEGIVYSSRPLSARGVLIENFSIRFDKGRAVEVHAEKNEEALRTVIAMDEGAAMLGECAFVPHDSPISNSGLMFYNTLFDENASCHLALGRGFANSINGFSNYTLEECRSKGINDSIIHEDFMIGTPDLSVTGITGSGSHAEIFRNGNWAF
ncbi:MAG: aminopeptidase [Clostridia bacterium]|nr:aminopeptidase [Clostridia bacterium]